MRSLARIWMVMVTLAYATGPGAAIGVAQEPSPDPLTDLPRFSIGALGDHDHQWFELTLDAGQTAQLTVGIRNVGEVDATLRTYAANAVNPPNGGFGAATEADAPVGATRWLDYPAETFDTRPGDARDIAFTVTVPPDVPPGEYVAALVVQTAEPISIPGAETFDQIIRGTISVEITVPGATTSGFALGQPVVSSVGGQWSLDVPIANTGSARIRPRGELIVTDANGDVVSTADIEMGSVYGGGATSVRVGLPGQLPPGDYRISLNLADEATGANAALEAAPVTIAALDAAEAPPVLVVDRATVTPNGDPVQYADVSASITNNGADIPTANVTLNVRRDGAVVESYPLARNQALPQGSSDINQRYIPVDGWRAGAYTFQLVVSAVDGGAETSLAASEIEDVVVIP